MSAEDPKIAQAKLAELLMEVAGRGVSRLTETRRHVHVLAEAIPYLSTAQAQVARDRIRAFETKWGRLLPGSPEINCTQSDEVAPAKIAMWLAKRNAPERLLEVLHRAATAIGEGENRLSRIMERAYETETDRVVHPVGYDSFREWMIELRIGQPNVIKKGRVEWGKGSNHWRWTGGWKVTREAVLKQLDKGRH